MSTQIRHHLSANFIKNIKILSSVDAVFVSLAPEVFTLFFYILYFIQVPDFMDCDFIESDFENPSSSFNSVTTMAITLVLTSTSMAS